MCQCARCGHDCVPNRISEDTINGVMHAGHTAHRAGFHAGAWGALAAMGVMKTINACRCEWRCTNPDCGHRF